MEFPKATSTFRCIFCRRHFASRPILVEHVDEEHADVALKCQVEACTAFFKDQELLEIHLAVHSAKKVRCDLCPSSAKTFPAHELLDHKKKVHSTSFCQICQTSVTSDQLLEHFKVYQCGLCGASCRCSGAFASHNKGTCDPPAKEEHERQTESSRPKKLKLEPDTDEEEVPAKAMQTFHCIFCSENFCETAAFEQHMAAEHKGAIRCCEKGCVAYFKDEALLDQHLRIHRQPERFWCSHCVNTSFTTWRALMLHRNTNHSTSFCQHCRVRVPRRLILDHFKAAKCPRCGASFRCTGSLAAHQAWSCVAETTESNCCSDCTERFDTKEQLEAHTNEAHAFSCDSCKTRIAPEAKAQHMTPANCNRCDEFFPCSKALQVHNGLCIAAERMLQPEEIKIE